MKKSPRGEKTTSAATTKVAAVRSLTIQFDKEDDGRIIAEIPELPGVMAYGANREEATLKVQSIAYRVLADRTEKERKPSGGVKFAFA